MSRLTEDANKFSAEELHKQSDASREALDDFVEDQAAKFSLITAYGNLAWKIGEIAVENELDIEQVITLIKSAYAMHILRMVKATAAPKQGKDAPS